MALQLPAATPPPSKPHKARRPAKSSGQQGGAGRVIKRPLMRPAIASPYANAKQEKCVYISARTPFVSAVKRVRRLQQQIIKRSLGSRFSLLDEKPAGGGGGGSGKDRTGGGLQRLEQAVSGGRNAEPVYLKGTGKAIEKVLGLGQYFQNQDDCRIQVKSYSVATVDDFEDAADEPVPPDLEDDMDKEDNTEDVEISSEAEKEKRPKSRIRHISGIEVAVFLK